MSRHSGSAPWWLPAFAALAMFLAAPALASPPPSDNLLQNPGAEAGASGHGQLVGVPGWKLTSSFSVDDFGDTDRPSTTDSQKIYGNNNYFFGGPGGASPEGDVATATQTVDVIPYADEIDKGALDYSFGGYLGGYASQGDTMKLRGEFLGSDGATLKTIAVAGSTPGNRGGKTGFVLKTYSDAVPSGTRSVRVTLTATRTEGNNNDGYADNLQLFLRERTPAGTAGMLGRMLPPVAATTLSALKASDAAAAVSLLAPKVAAKILASMSFAAGLKVLQAEPTSSARVRLLNALPSALAARYRSALG